MARTGRPPRITEPFDVTREGRARTIGDAVCDHLRVGVYLETACSLVGLHPDTVRGWLRDGADARQRRSRGAKRRDLTHYQRLAADFSVAAHEALAECERRDVGRLGMLAAGAIPLTTVTEKMHVYTDADGQETTTIVERTVVTKETLPDLRAIAFRLQRRFPQRWSPRIEVEVGADLPHAAGAADRSPAATALAELERKVERSREVRAALGGAVIDVKLADDKPPQTNGETDGD